MIFKIVCWTSQYATQTKRNLSKMGEFVQPEPLKKHVVFFRPMIGAEVVTFSILRGKLEAGQLLKIVVWDFSQWRLTPAEDKPIETTDEGDPFMEEDSYV